MINVRLHPALSQAALRQRQDKALRLWVVLRALDAEGRGHISLDEAKSSLRTELNLSGRSVRRVLADGAGRWWSSDGVTLHLRSLDSVCRALKLERKPGAPVEVALDDIRSLARFRSFCLSAQFANEKAIDRPVSLNTLAGRVGRSRRTVFSYIRASGARVQRNVLHSIRRPVPLDAGGRAQGWHFTLADDGKPIMAKRLPNSYFLDVLAAPEGRGRKVRIAGKTRDEGRGVTPRQQFVSAYRDATKAAKTLRKMAEGDQVCITERPPTAAHSSAKRTWDGYAKTKGGIQRL